MGEGSYIGKNIYIVQLQLAHYELLIITYIS